MVRGSAASGGRRGTRVEFTGYIVRNGDVIIVDELKLPTYTKCWSSRARYQPLLTMRLACRSANTGL
jgi:hypothetical protein